MVACELHLVGHRLMQQRLETIWWDKHLVVILSIGLTVVALSGAFCTRQTHEPRLRCGHSLANAGPGKRAFVRIAVTLENWGKLCDKRLACRLDTLPRPEGWRIRNRLGGEQVTKVTEFCGMGLVML